MLAIYSYMVIFFIFYFLKKKGLAVIKQPTLSVLKFTSKRWTNRKGLSNTFNQNFVFQQKISYPLNARIAEFERVILSDLTMFGLPYPLTALCPVNVRAIELVSAG